MAEYFLAKEEKGKIFFSECKILDNPESMKLIDHEIRRKILELIKYKAMYPAEIAKKLKIHEQKIYYHIKQLHNAGILGIKEKIEIRGTVAKSYYPKAMNFAVTLSDEWAEQKTLGPKNKLLNDLFEPFITNGVLDAIIVVGSPDPHGPYRVSARDGHYTADLCLFLGQFCRIPEKFSVKLDVDVKSEKEEQNNLILVGGPGPNLITYEINKFLPIRFDITSSEHGFSCSGLVSEKTGRVITDETAGIIARIKNPYNPTKKILFLAGLKQIGVKSAVIGLTRFHDQILQKFSEGDFAVVVVGYDLDGDGKIDSVEIIE